LNAITAFSLNASASLNSAEELEAALRQIGATRYIRFTGCCTAAN